MTRSWRPELDGIRGIAIALVVAKHALFPSEVLQGGGIVGVQLFFVLSGFLITGILVDEQRSTGRISLRGFYSRRARRLFPALAVFLLAYLAWSVLASQPRGPMIAEAALYVSNWGLAAGTPLFELEHLWSLAVEEQFYLVWPLLLIALGTILRGRWVLVLVIATIGVVAWRAGLYGSGASWDRVYFGTDTVAAPLLAGAALAIAGVRFGAAAAWTGLAAVLALAFFVPDIKDSRPLLIYVGLPAAVIAGVALIGGAARLPALRWRGLVWLGGISYALYLWHSPINRILAFYGWDVAGRLIAIPIAVVIAWASTRFVEARFRAPSRPRVDREVVLLDRARRERALAGADAELQS